MHAGRGPWPKPFRSGRVTGPESLTDEDVLSFLLAALRPWLER